MVTVRLLLVILGVASVKAQQRQGLQFPPIPAGSLVSVGKNTFIIHNTQKTSGTSITIIIVRPVRQGRTSNQAIVPTVVTKV